MMTPRTVHQVLKPLREIGAAFQSLEAAALEMIRWEAALTEVQTQHAALTQELARLKADIETTTRNAQQIKEEAAATSAAFIAEARNEVTATRTKARAEIERLQGETRLWTGRLATAQAEHEARLAELSASEVETKRRMDALVDQARTLAKQAQALG